MVDGVGDGAVVNAEPEHDFAGSNVDSDVIMVESDVRPNEGDMLIDESNAIRSEVDQNMKAEPVPTDKDLAYDGEEDGKANMEEISEDGDTEFSEFNSTSCSVHGEEDMGKKSEATGCKDVSLVATGDVGPISVEEEIDDGSLETVERNGEIQVSTDLPPTHEGSIMMAPAENICSTVDNAVIHHEPTVESASVDNDNVHPVSSSARNLAVLDSGQQQILGNATVASSVTQQTEDFEEHMQSNLGKVQESTNGFPCSGNAVELQDYSNDTEMIDSGEVNEEPQELISGSSLSQSEDEDDDEKIGSVSHLQENANDPENEGTAIYIQEDDTVTENVPLQQDDDNDDDEGEGEDEEEDEDEDEDEDEEPITGAEKSLHREEKNAKRVASKVGPLEKEYRATYDLPLETADQFSVNDLVWGKVKSHPWWPGQIFDPSDSSEKAMKHYKKDCYLVAYFGDKSFAWNEASQLKPFRAHFSQGEKQSSSEAFQNAIDCALEEVSRRVELGLTCSCMPEETYDSIKFQIVENAGIQTASSKREGGDGHISSESFQPDKLLNYVRSLAQLPTCGANQLELSIAKAQLLSFYRLKGHQSLPEVQFFVGLVENDVDALLPEVNSLPSESEHADSVAVDGVSCTVRSKGPKRKHNLKDIVYHRRKEKSFSEIMGESLYYYDEDYESDEKTDGKLNSPTLGRKRKASNFLDDESKVPEKTRTISVAKVSKAADPSPRQSFKIGDCIRRAASQLTGSSSTLKSTDDGNNEQLGHDPDPDKSLDAPEDAQNENTEIATEETSPDDFLSEFYLTAQDPMRAHGFSKSVVSFFSEFRDAAVSAQRKSNEKSSTTARGRSGRKRKSYLGLSPEAFEFDDRKDSYWADMVVENNSEAKPPRRSRKKKDPKPVTGDPEKPKKSAQRRNSRKQKVNGDHHELTAEQLSVDEVKPDLPTELILSFGDNSVPSVADLNRMFRRFGPLKESGTEVDKENSRARLVFKNGSDAEIAYSSAVTFNIFGSITVNYQLTQTPPVPSHTSAPASAHCTEDAA